MVERAAAAIAKAIDEVTYVGDTDDLACVVVDGNVNLLAAARAAIEAMREPTEAMCRVQDDVVYLRDLWPRMIDAALSA